jgi:hypothetical protein
MAFADGDRLTHFLRLLFDVSSRQRHPVTLAARITSTVDGGLRRDRLHVSNSDISATAVRSQATQVHPNFRRVD